MRLFALSLAVALLGTAGAASAQVAIGPGSIVARVRDTGGKPLAGALVEVTGPTTRDVTTNASGIGALVALPAGHYDVSVSRAGYTTYATRLTIASTSNAPQVVAPELGVASFATLPAAASLLGVDDASTADPYAAHAVERDAATDVVATAGLAAVSIDGTAPYESRVELDGIPLAGGATSPAAVRFRDLPGLASIDVAASPYVESPSVRNAIGGVVDLRTASLDDPQRATIDAGYDSAFGSFQHARAVEDSGGAAIAFDAVAGGGEDRSQVLKARYAFSPQTSVDVGAYGLQAAGTIGTAAVTTNARAYVAGLRVGLGAGTFDVRTFASALAVTTSLPTPLVPNETAHDAGLQMNYDLPLGADRLQIGFDRRSERTTDGSTTFDQTFSTFDVRGGFAIARALRMQLADAYSGGTLLPARNDPAATLAYRPTSALRVELAAGSTFATAPDAVLAERSATSPVDVPPETSFGYRLTGDLRLDASDRAWLDAYRERRFATFGPLADASNRGVGLGFSRTPLHGIGGRVYAALNARAAYGAPQASDRIAPALEADGQTAGEPFAKARAALTYEPTAGCRSRVGVTYVGSGNALAGHAVALGDVSLCIPLFGIANLRVGEENVFGVTVANAALAPLSRPREVFFTLGRTR